MRFEGVRRPDWPAAVVVALLFALQAAGASDKPNQQKQQQRPASTTTPPAPPVEANRTTSSEEISDLDEVVAPAAARGREKSGTATAAAEQLQSARLPTWFNFEAYKSLYGKRYAAGPLDELHKRIYLRTSLRVFEQRARFRARRLGALASVNELSDLTSEQLESFKEGGARAPFETAAVDARPPDCCSYDQVYGKIIELLERADGARDAELSRALVAELKQKPLLVNQMEGDGPARRASNELGAPPPPPPQGRQGRMQPIGTRPPAEAQNRRRLAESPPTKRAAGPNNSPAGFDTRARPRNATSAPPPSLDWRGRKRPDAPKQLGSAGLGGASLRAAGGPAEGLGGAQVSPAVEEAVRRQFAEYLSPRSAFGRKWRAELSEYFGEPVEVVTKLAGSSASARARAKAGRLGGPGASAGGTVAPAPSSAANSSAAREIKKTI